MAEGFLLRRWTVDVGRWGCATIIATSRGKALARAHRSDVFEGYSFGEFLRMARCRLDRSEPPERWGDPITVEGKAAFFCGSNRAYVELAYPGGDHVICAHPYDVLPIEYRPEVYRDRIAA